MCVYMYLAAHLTAGPALVPANLSLGAAFNTTTTLVNPGEGEELTWETQPFKWYRYCRRSEPP